MSSNINPALIPAADAQNLGHTFLSAVRRYYEDPEHVRAFGSVREKHNSEIVKNKK